ncbi:MAG: S41 family peptidase, partial [Flavobacterium sp.]
RYGNVNIYLTDMPWDDVLTEFVPRFKTTVGIEFEYLKDELFVKLNDSHSDYQASYYLNTKVKRFSTYKAKNINDSLVITTIYDPIRARESNIALGDIIFKVEGKSVKDYRESTLGKYVSVSNPNYLKWFESFYFPALGDQESMTVSIKKKSGEIIERTVPLLSGEEFKNFKTVESLFKEQKAPELGNDIGYLHLGRATKKKLKNFFKANSSKQNIILDLRNYPENIRLEDIASYLLPHRTTFFKALGWYGPALGDWDSMVCVAKIIDPFVIGRENKNYYKGTVVLLVDHTTLSSAEFIGMGIQQAPRCITVGKQTGGAVTNRVEVLLKDDTTID